MTAPVIALLHPGEMGAAVGACARERGARVLYASAGRSTDSRARAEAAGLADGGTVAAIVRDAGILLSVCPPHAAVDVANEVAAVGFRGVYVDANAIAPDTTRRIAAIVGAGGATFVDGGIIGPPPRAGVRSRLYLAGEGAADVAALFESTPLGAVDMRSPIGAASAIKACYAAWTKGVGGLLANIRALAAHEGITEALLAEWSDSQPDMTRRTDVVRGNARKAWRWIAEMEEIAASFRAAGLPDGFHLACADTYTRLAGFKDTPGQPPIEDIERMLLEAGRREDKPA